MCSTTENLDRVHQKSSNSQSPTHSRPANVVADKLSKLGQTIQRVVSPSGGLPSNMQPVAPASNRPICHEVQQQVASVCVTRTGSPGHNSGCTKSAMGGSGHVYFPTRSHLGQSDGEVTGLPMQENHSDCSGEAQQALVLGSNKSQLLTSLCAFFEDRKLQPSTIDGYRSTIADKLGILPVIVSKDGNLTRLLDSFHRDRPKGRRGIPSWNLSLVLHQLTKAPFEPILEASLKHLTCKI